MAARGLLSIAVVLPLGNFVQGETSNFENDYDDELHNKSHAKKNSGVSSEEVKFFVEAEGAHARVDDSDEHKWEGDGHGLDDQGVSIFLPNREIRGGGADEKKLCRFGQLQGAAVDGQRHGMKHDCSWAQEDKEPIHLPSGFSSRQARRLKWRRTV